MSTARFAQFFMASKAGQSTSRAITAAAASTVQILARPDFPVQFAIQPTVDCYVRQGPASIGAVTANDQLLVAGSYSTFRVDAHADNYLSILAATTDGLARIWAISTVDDVFATAPYSGVQYIESMLQTLTITGKVMAYKTPLSVIPDDVLILCVSTEATDLEMGTIEVPAGWTLLIEQLVAGGCGFVTIKQAIFWRRAIVGEPSDVTVVLSGYGTTYGTPVMSASIVNYRRSQNPDVGNVYTSQTSDFSIPHSTTVTVYTSLTGYTATPTFVAVLQSWSVGYTNDPSAPEVLGVAIVNTGQTLTERRSNTGNESGGLTVSDMITAGIGALASAYEVRNESGVLLGQTAVIATAIDLLPI